MKFQTKHDDHIPISFLATILVFLSFVLFESAGAATYLAEILNSQQILLKSNSDKYLKGDRLMLKSSDDKVGIIAIFEIIEGVESKGKDKLQGQHIYIAQLLRGSSRNFVKVGDELFLADLSTENSNYNAQTDLLDRGDSLQFVSNRYRSLYTQGIGIGETAETLKRNEYLFTWYGLLAYGAQNWLSVSSILPLSIFGGPNLQTKIRFYNSYETKLAAGISLWKVPGSTESVVNLNFMWDSFSSSSMISHSFVTLAVLSYDNSEETTAMKSLGSTALQSGYEFLLPNWSRVLVGPNYNFETKALGGYISYLKIWDHVHFQLSLASNNLSSFRANVKEGYYGFFDAYWRY